jgi:hypothetical protein
MSVGVFRLRALSYLFEGRVGIVEGHWSRVTFIPHEGHNLHSFGKVILSVI